MPSKLTEVSGKLTGDLAGLEEQPCGLFNFENHQQTAALSGPGENVVERGTRRNSIRFLILPGKIERIPAVPQVEEQLY